MKDKFLPRTWKRRDLTGGLAALLGSLAVGAKAQARSATRSSAQDQALESQGLTGYSRYQPSFGGPPDHPYYMGKLMPGLRPSGQAPVLMQMPDVGDVPWKMVGGVKQFELNVEPVTREFLPGFPMSLWGFNGSVPGPSIQCTQGDRVRILVHNKLPEVTTIHWHGLDVPNRYDGIPGLTQPPIQPGETFVYEFDINQTGTFFYHPHTTMPEAFGMVGYFIVHPKVEYDPPVDRDFGLIFQNFHISENTNIPDSWSMDFNWHTINGRSGPFTTPLVCKHGERVRVRILDFSPIQHHPIHMHGHSFWITGTEGGRLPQSSWVLTNNQLIGVAQARVFEFIANNPGDWMLHCHMVHHMMNHMVQQVGPRIRSGATVDEYLEQVDQRPAVNLAQHSENPRFQTPGYPQLMRNMYMSKEAMMRIHGRQEVRGMQTNWHEAVKGLMTVMRVLPEDVYNQVMLSSGPIQPGLSVPQSFDPQGGPPLGQDPHRLS